MSNYSASHYKGKPAVYDLKTRVVYFGFRTMKEARTRADELNRVDRNALQPKARE